MKLAWILNWKIGNPVKFCFYTYPFEQNPGWYTLTLPFHIFDGAGNLQRLCQAPVVLGEVKFLGKCLHLYSIIKVIKEKWGQYFAIDHFCTPLCSKWNGNIVIKKILEQKFAKSSVVNLVPNAWFNDKMQ